MPKKSVPITVFVLSKKITDSPGGISYIKVDKDGIADYTRDPAQAKMWKTLEGVGKWIRERGAYWPNSYFGYTVTEMEVLVDKES